jgi:hypothetical protein
LSTDQVVSTKDWAKKIIDMYEAGASDAEVAASRRITLQEYYDQMNDNAAFAKLVQFGRTLAQAFWEGQFRKNLSNKQFNTSLLAFYMKNKYGWADKTENVNSDTGSTDVDALRAQVTKQVAKFLKENTPELTDAQRLLSDMAASMNDE